jgi:hypothetical protein
MESGHAPLLCLVKNLGCNCLNDGLRNKFFNEDTDGKLFSREWMGSKNGEYKGSHNETAAAVISVLSSRQSVAVEPCNTSHLEIRKATWLWVVKGAYWGNLSTQTCMKFAERHLNESSPFKAPCRRKVMRYSIDRSIRSWASPFSELFCNFPYDSYPTLHRQSICSGSHFRLQFF